MRCTWVAPVPWRRLGQHNGRESGGVERLASGRPWAVVLFVYGFPHHVAALHFEKAWQRGFKSNCMQNVQRFSPRRGPAGKVQILRALLHTPVWRDARLSVHLVERAPNARCLTAALVGYRLLTRGPHL
jgi:hypothetical protein